MVEAKRLGAWKTGKSKKDKVGAESTHIPSPSWATMCQSFTPPPPFPSQTANEEMIDQVILDNFELRGSTKPPSIYDVLWVQLLLRSERQRTASA